MKEYKIFTINPGSTSTKIAMFEAGKCTFSKSVSHNAGSLKSFRKLEDQLPYRRETILSELKENDVSLRAVDAFVGRGGGCFPVEGGTYVIDELLLDHTRRAVAGIEHPANLGIQLADEFARQFGGREFMVNPPTVDEYQDLARVTGIDGVYRSSNLHALNQKEMAIRHAALIGRNYEDCNFIGCHIGGGISVVAHKQGKMVDGNDIVGGEGPMAPTRCGGVPAAAIVRLCFSGKCSEKELLDKAVKSGGFLDVLGTSDALEVLGRIEKGDAKAKLYWDTMVYQIEKMIGAMASVLKGRVDGILLGGGLVRDEHLVSAIMEACGFIAPVSTYAGEFEMEAMAAGASRVLAGQETEKRYLGRPVWDGFTY